MSDPMAMAKHTAISIHPPKSRADYLAEARQMAAAGGYGEEVAQRIANLEAWINPDAKRASQDAFYEAYGVRRGDDPRGGPVRPLYPMVLKATTPLGVDAAGEGVVAS